MHLIAYVSPGPWRDVLTLVLGVLTGVLSGAFGVGGAIVATPGVRFLGASTFLAVGTTLPAIVPGAVAATARYAREGLIDWPAVAAAAPAGMVAAVIGSLAAHAVPGDGHWLMVLTAALLALAAIRMGRSANSPRPAPEGPSPARRRHGAPAAAGVGASAGLLSGLLGVGGGLLLVPGFGQLLGLPMKHAIATSLACVGIIAVPGTLTHAVLGAVDWRIAGLLALAAIPGARLGAAVAITANEAHLRRTVALTLGIVAVIYAATEVAAMV